MIHTITRSRIQRQIIMNLVCLFSHVLTLSHIICVDKIPVIQVSHCSTEIEDVFVLCDRDRGALCLIVKSAVDKYAYLLTYLLTSG